MNDYSSQLMNTLFLLAGSALLAIAAPPAPRQLAAPPWMAGGERDDLPVAPCGASEPRAPGYFESVAMSLANSDGPVPVDTGCGTQP